MRLHNIYIQTRTPSQVPSVFGFGSYGWLQTSAFYILGISFIALAAALVLKINSKINLARLWSSGGVAFILVAGNHVQNPGTVITLSEKVHRDSAIAIVIMSPLACYLLAPSLKASGHRGLWIYSMVPELLPC